MMKMMEVRASPVFLFLIGVFIIIPCGCESDGNKGSSKHRGHNIPMGIRNSCCDDGRTNLTTDYDGSPVNYTCYEDQLLYLPNSKVRPLLEHESIPRFYIALHYCMNTTISYNSKIPTFGPHRPLWPEYGEYLFLPKQRWLHNLEHGAIVMLYHPCADRNEVKFLKKILKNCLFRHIITPSTDLTYDRPLALVSWGYRLLLSKVDMEVVIRFVKHHANRAPEKTAKDGQYSFLIIEHANIISGTDDTEICPFYNM